jgi:ABC-type multidrug transport system fused ATPase/permease subunit
VSQRLPVAEGPEVRAQARVMMRRHRGGLALVSGLHALAAVAGLAGPALLGRLVEDVQNGTTKAHIDTIALVLAGFIVLQTVFTWAARRSSFVLAELAFAELREEFMRRVLALPLSTVERAGTGDLVSRTTADVDSLARTIRFAIPETLIATVTAFLTVFAAFLVDPLVALPCLVGVPLIWVGTRWYLKRAPAGYLWERAAYATMTGTVGETVDGGRTIDALGLAEQRIRRIDADLEDAWRAERRTLFLRTVWFPTVEFAYVLPVVATLVWGGWLVYGGHTSIGAVTAVALYTQQLADPVDRLISWLDEIQVGASSYARLVGVAKVPDDRQPTGEQPEHEELRAEDVRYAYVEGRDVLHGIDLDLQPGERVAVVGPSGAGKSTLGRLLAGIHPPRTGRVDVGGVRLVDLTLDVLRQEVALITQEQHVFVGTLADNLRLAHVEATDDQLESALDAVDALGWASALPHGVETVVGAGGWPLSPSQQQQVALARLVLADPHTLVLDEATSLLDPRAARHLERSLASVLTGRTVVAIAHRLHTAHDADRVAVVEDGLLSEFGTHHELVEQAGSYAALWQSWHGDGDGDGQGAGRR